MDDNDRARLKAIQQGAEAAGSQFVTVKTSELLWLLGLVPESRSAKPARTGSKDTEV